MTDQFAKKSEAWSARFSEPVADLVERLAMEFEALPVVPDWRGRLDNLAAFRP